MKPLKNKEIIQKCTEYFLFGLLLVATFVQWGCPSQETTPDIETSIKLTLTSTVDIDTLRIRLRTSDPTLSDEINKDLSNIDLTTNEYVIVLRPSSVFTDEFFIYAQGYRKFQTEPLVAESTLLSFTQDQERAYSLILREGFIDKDGDGFEQCTGAMLCDCDDSLERGFNINPYRIEECSDPYDNNCNGVVNEGCDCIEDAPCTDLTPNLWDFAGVGACHFGVLRCLPTGEYAIECEDAGSPTDELPNNFIDDDCDGNVDEGSACVSGVVRPCFLGFVDDPNHPVEDDRLAASDRALGECRAGSQTCSDAGFWLSCEGETRPQRSLFQEKKPNGETVLRPGIGWQEVLFEGVIDQCDGLDNDCDGQYDEEAVFDVDRDNYTFCGTCPTLQSPRLCDEFVDCDDNNVDIHPGATELCGNNVDEDCACDHGNFIGRAFINVDGSFSCSAEESYLSCDLLPRSDTNPTGACSDMPQPYYYGFLGSTSANQKCYYCGLDYGKACDEESKTCQTKEASCLNCDLIGPVAQERPFCTDVGSGCVNADEPVWTALISQDPYNECGALSCDGYYWGIEDNHCYLRANQSAAQVNCKGAQACELAEDLCPFESTKQVNPVPNPGMCIKVDSGCAGQVPPVWTDQDNNEDLFEDCTENFACDASNGEQAYFYGLVDTTPSDGTNNKICHFTADVPNNYCNGLGACQTRAQACATSSMGDEANGLFARPQCQRPIEETSSINCSGEEPPVYENIELGEDPYNECDGRGCCVDSTGKAVCCAPIGAPCSVGNQCQTGFCRTDWDNAGSFCANTATSCVYDNGTSVEQREENYVECGNGDSYRVCQNGQWLPSVTCSATNCDNDCGFISDFDNACISGGNTAVAGCEAVLGINVICEDCGDFSAENGACNETISGCNKGCGASCIEGESELTGQLYCSDDGESMNTVISCLLFNDECILADAGPGDDQVETLCSDNNINCNSATGECFDICTENSQCNAGFNCDENGDCIANFANGATCSEDTDCISGHCQNGYCCTSGDCCLIADNCPGSYRSSPACDDHSNCQGTRDDALCVSNQCGTSLDIPDDSGCTATIEVNACGFYPSIFCDGSLEQSAPSCAVSCSGDGDCDLNAHCDDSICVEDLADGAVCDESSDCESGNCIDGFCCETSCGGGATNDCQSCAGAQTGVANGICAIIDATVNYQCNAPGGDATCDPADTCDGSSTSCPANEASDGTSCGSGPSCTGSGSSYSQISQETCSSAACSGGGTTSDCNGFICDGTTCFTSCSGDNPHSRCDDTSHCGDCSTGTFCSGTGCETDTHSYSLDIASIFSTNCTSACHGGVEWTRSNTVGVNGDHPSYCDGQTLIDPGNLAGSCLWSLVENDLMPTGGTPLDNALKDKLRIWILEGAKDN